MLNPVDVKKAAVLVHEVDEIDRVLRKIVEIAKDNELCATIGVRFIENVPHIPDSTLESAGKSALYGYAQQLLAHRAKKVSDCPLEIGFRDPPGIDKALFFPNPYPQPAPAPALAKTKG